VLVHALHENFAEFRFEGARYSGDSHIYTYGAMKYITNLKNHLTENLECFMIRTAFALYPGISRKGIWSITNGITNDRKHEGEVEFVGKKTSKGSTNEASATRAAIQEHRAVLGLVNPTDKISKLEKDKERYYRLFLRHFVFLDRELERKVEMKLSEETNEEWERRKAFLMGKRFDVVPLCNIKAHFVTIDSAVLYGIIKEISAEFNIRREHFTGENQETYWKKIFGFKRLKTSKQKVFAGMIETDGVNVCVHYRRLKQDRPVPLPAAPSMKHEDENESDPATQEVEDTDLVVGADPGHMIIINIAARKRAADAIHGNLHQTDMCLLRFSRARYYRESGMINARKKIET
jgi:hypothetical protein